MVDRRLHNGYAAHALTVRLSVAVRSRGSGSRRLLGLSARHRPGGPVGAARSRTFASLQGAGGFRARARPVGRSLNEGQVYMTLTRLAKAGLVGQSRPGGRAANRKVYVLTGRATTGSECGSRTRAGRSRRGRVSSQACGGGCRWARRSGRDRRRATSGAVGRTADAQQAALSEPDGSVAALLLEGVMLRLQADLRWLEECARIGPR